MLGGGGLHIFLSYPPDNSRIEWQAYGRSGRQGVVGSSQMVLEKQEIYDVYRHKVDIDIAYLQNFNVVWGYNTLMPGL